MLQKWSHDVIAGESLGVAAQERRGPNQPDSVDLDDQPADSHVARTDQEPD
jgi:porphyrinogen peroxidase